MTLSEQEVVESGWQEAYRYARLEARLVAAVLDLLVVASFFLLFFTAALLELLVTSDFGDTDPSGLEVYIAIAILLFYIPCMAGYFILMWSWRGQTVGQMAMHVIVIRRDGEQLRPVVAGLRFIGYLLGVLTVFMGFAMAFLDAEKRALHDRLADTIVVEAP